MVKVNCDLATVINNFLSYEVTGIDQDINTDMTSCKEIIGVLDGNFNLHWNSINMNTLNSSIRECDRRSSRSKNLLVKVPIFLYMWD